MSRKQRPRRSSKTTPVEQAPPPVQRAQRVPNIRPGATNFQPVSPVQSGRPMNMRPFSTSVINQMYQNFGPQSNQDSLYSPGAPIRPIPGLLPPEGPRGFNYTVGYNIAQLPRSEEQYSFADLRAMASMYYGVQMCQQVWFDYISKLELVVEPRKELLAENMDMTPYEDDIQYYQDFFAYPDKDHDFHSWLQMAVRDQLEIDAVSIFVRKDRIGRPYSLDLIDSAIIKPLITDRGRTPEPPYPAYEQFVHGIPAAFLTTDDLIYIKETERSDSVYGRSRVEKIMLYVTMALRKQTKDLARFTDGTLPEGFIIPSMDVQWSQEEIEAFEIDLNNLMAGNDEMRARLKVLPRGFTFEDTQDADIHMDLDEFILNVCAAGHGITMSELAFTADVNRATGEMQENVVYRRAMGPLMNRYSKLFTMILRKFFKETRFVVKLRGYGEVEDFQSQSTAYATLVGAGIQSPTQAAHAMNLPVYDNKDVPPFVVTKTGPIMVDDLADPEVRAASKAAFIAGASGQSSGSQGQQKDGEEEDEPDDEDEASASQAQDKQPPKPGQKDDEKATLSRIAEVMANVEESLRLIRARDVTPDAHAPGVPMVSKQGTCDCAVCWTNNGKTLSDGRRPPYHDGCDCAAIPQSTQRSDAPAEQTGMMIAFMLDPETAAQLAIPGGVPAEEMHVTLAYLGRMDEVTLDVEALRRELAAFASESAPLSGTTGGVGRFTPSESSEGKSPVIALVNVPGLQQFRASLVQRLENIGVWYAQNFDYQPHCTLMYAEPAAPMPIESLPQVPLVFDRLVLAIGNEHTQFPMGVSPIEEENPRVQIPQSRSEIAPGSRDRSERAPESDESARARTEVSAVAASGLDRAKSISQEYRRWRTRAIEDVKAGKTRRPFESTLIPQAAHALITESLAACKTPEDVRTLFEMVRDDETHEREIERDTSPKVLASVSGGNPQQSRSAWKLRW